jgi:ethanolamine ammonia-lyase small subunit
MVLRDDVIEVPDDVWRKLLRLANGARLCLDRHGERMKTDSEYREAVEHLTKLLSSLPGHLGQTVRIVAAGNTLLVKVL